MNEFIFTEFLFDENDLLEGMNLLRDIGPDFCQINFVEEFDIENSGPSSKWIRISGKISSTAATAIKLSNNVLSKNMHVSYIPSDLKNKYRNR